MKQRTEVALLAVVFGMLGSVVSNLLVSGDAAIAKEIDVSTRTDRPSRVIVGENFRLVDAEGKTRASLGVDPSGTAYLSIFDKDQKNAVKICAFAGGKPGVALLSRHGKARCVLRLGPDDSPILAFNDENGKTRVLMGKVDPKQGNLPLPARPASSLLLLDKNEKVIWQAP